MSDKGGIQTNAEQQHPTPEVNTGSIVGDDAKKLVYQALCVIANDRGVDLGDIPIFDGNTEKL